MHVIIALLCFAILLSVSPTARLLTMLVVFVGVLAYVLHCNEGTSSIPIATPVQAAETNERTKPCQTQKGLCLNVRPSIEDQVDRRRSEKSIAPVLPSVPLAQVIQTEVPKTCAGFIYPQNYVDHDNANPGWYNVGGCPFYGFDPPGVKILSKCHRGNYCVVRAIVRTKGPRNGPPDDFYIKNVVSVFPPRE
jgi:hypothetical protein